MNDLAEFYHIYSSSSFQWKIEEQILGFLFHYTMLSHRPK